MKKIIYIIVSIVTLIAFVGIFKFDYLASLSGYDVDGNYVGSRVHDLASPNRAPDTKGGYLIETEVDNPDNCVGVEQYDAENNVCYVECDTQEECDAIQKQIDEALDVLDVDYQAFSQKQNLKKFDVRKEKKDVDYDQEKAEVVYTINKGENFVLVSGTELPSHTKIKKWIKNISPNDFSDRFLNRLVLLENTDDDSAAYVIPSQSDDSASKWDIYVNMTSLREDGKKEMVFTLIHEYAHILTLNTSQVHSDITENNCNNYYTQEGCMSSSSYLNDFYQRFWNGRGFDIESDDSLDNYDRAPKSFVTAYAATNPGEDIAESFATFVIRKKPLYKPNLTIAEQKILFFYNYLELVQMRHNIRTILKGFVRQRLRGV